MSRTPTPKKSKPKKRAVKSKQQVGRAVNSRKSDVLLKDPLPTPLETARSEKMEQEVAPQYLKRIKRNDAENLQLQLQIQILRAECELLSQKELELQEKLLSESAHKQQIMVERLQAEQQVQDLQTETQLLTSRLQKFEADNTALDQQLRTEQREKQLYLEKNQTLEAKLQSGNVTIENLLNQKQDLEKRLSEQKYLIALEWAQGLGEVLTKLSALAEKEPEPVLGLKPRAIYETLLSWLEKAFGKRPKMFPSSKEFTTTAEGKYLITLDADVDGIEALLRRYDWSHERPFENKREMERQCQFKVIHWGWTVNDIILVRAKITVYHSEN
jgi:hypothetical protein